MATRATLPGPGAAASAARAMVVGVSGLLGAVGLLAALAPAAGAQTLDDLEDAEERVEDLTGLRDEAVDRYEATWAAVEQARVELDTLSRRTEELQAEVVATTSVLEDRARLAFKRGPLELLEVLLRADDADLALERVALLSAAQRRDQLAIEAALAAQAALARAEILLASREDELVDLRTQLEVEAAALQEELEQATAETAELATLVSRQRRVDRGAQQGIYACIFDAGAYRFRDTWGAPRAGGTWHRGTDVFAAYRAPVYAITSGTIARRSNSPLGGLGLYLWGDDGNQYYYAHLDAIEPAGRVGNRVVAGELIARNGHTGNASPSAPHVHLELHPGGGAHRNPYPWLAAACF
ncbi:MAG: murein hydrolase activator EnvC family protein [Nitriliruptoraceae bacterium]